MPHRIRLRVGWSAADSTSRGTISLPCPASSTTPLTRHFGKPSGVGPDQRVWLVLQWHGTLPELELNGEKHTPEGQPCEVDITASLRDRNLLRCVLGEGSELLSVELEIRH